MPLVKLGPLLSRNRGHRAQGTQQRARYSSEWGYQQLPVTQQRARHSSPPSLFFLHRPIRTFYLRRSASSYHVRVTYRCLPSAHCILSSFPALSMHIPRHLHPSTRLFTSLLFTSSSSFGHHALPPNPSTPSPPFSHLHRLESTRSRPHLLRPAVRPRLLHHPRRARRRRGGPRRPGAPRPAPASAAAGRPATGR